MKQFMMITAAMLLMAGVSQAQTEKGDQVIGLSLGINTSNTNLTTVDVFSPDAKITQHSVTLMPSYSLFIANGLDLAIRASYSNYDYSDATMPSQNQNYSLQKQHSRSYSAGVFLRKYLLYDQKVGVRFGPYLEYGHSEISYDYFDVNGPANNNSKGPAYTGGAQVDLVYYPAKRVGLTAILGNVNYTYAKTEGNPQNSTSNQINVNLINNGLVIGVYYLL
jgi:hypothetical protein